MLIPRPSNKIPERKLLHSRHQAGQAIHGERTCPAHRYDAETEVSRGSQAPEYLTLRGQENPSRLGCSLARNGGKVSDATFAACSDLIGLIRLSLPSSRLRSHWLYQGLLTLIYTLCFMFWFGVGGMLLGRLLYPQLLRIGGA